MTGGARSVARRWALGAVLAAATLLVGALVAGVVLYRVAEGNIERVELPSLADKERAAVGEPGQPVNVLVVGSDSREGLSEEEARALRLGEAGGQRGDVVLLVSVSADREHASVVSFPRDLLVDDDGEKVKLTETLADGPDHLLSVLQRETGVPIHHYVEVSIPGFLGIVDAVGGVELCLDDPLRDRRSGADFDVGCHEMSPEEALAYVRSRATPRGDFDRIERQQRFLAAMVDRLVSTRTVVDVPRLFDLVDRVSRQVRADAELDRSEMRRLARELRDLAAGDVPMTTLPSYAVERDGLHAVAAFEPGARTVYEALATGEPVPERGSREQRAETVVAVLAGGRPEAAERVAQTLHWAAFEAWSAGEAPASVEETTVYAVGDERSRAEWVAAVLGVEVRPLPRDHEPPDGVAVVVAVGDDISLAAGEEPAR